MVILTGVVFEDDILKVKMRMKVSWSKVEEDLRDDGWLMEKLSGLGKLLGVFEGKVRELVVVVGKVRGREYRVDLWLDLPSKQMKVSGRGSELEKAVVEAREKMKRKLKKHVGKLRKMKIKRERG